jgi:hypothetical protein
VGLPLPPDAELRVVAERLGGDPDRAGEVALTSIYAPVASASAGIWRVAGPEWSAVLKVLRHGDGGHPNWQSGAEVGHWYYWRREADAYHSGLLASLAGGVRAPVCLLVTQRPDGTVALWLEDVPGLDGGRWPLERYGIAARHLGQAQGEFLAGRPLPEDPWLSRRWLRSYVRQRDADLPLLDEPTAWEHPVVRRWFPMAPVAAARRMREDQARLLAVIDGLPRTLCHLDLHPSNLISSGATTVVIDWAFVGIGAVGEDAGNLVPDSVLDFHVAPADLDQLFELVHDGYLAGLRDAGWDGPAELVRLGMTATIAAKYAWILPAILRVTSEGRNRLNGRPVAEAMRWWGPVVPFLLRCADDARRLSPRSRYAVPAAPGSPPEPRRDRRPARPRRGRWRPGPRG